jgi:hypothetical protein
MMKYDKSFHKRRDEKTRYAAKTILSHVYELFPEIDSVVDIGCGVGTWLSVIKEMGIRTIEGIDGPWMQPEQLVIPAACFRSVDLTKPNGLRLERRYDLAICLELVEHLSEANACQIVQSLVSHSNIILFSAAIPGQGGVGHLNEQWPNYWVNQFSHLGYKVADVIRFKIWNDNNIPWWYRQNVMLFLHNELAQKISNSQGNFLSTPLPLVHPELFHQRTENTIQVLRSLIFCLGKALCRHLGLRT